MSYLTLFTLFTPRTNMKKFIATIRSWGLGLGCWLCVIVILIGMIAQFCELIAKMVKDCNHNPKILYGMGIIASVVLLGWGILYLGGKLWQWAKKNRK